ncbi:hypothetical protein [Dyadobacter sp. OTU695]|uniref:hypothetical protein n=1 Tax=Dyadobacter sp. OTU695 TaxID=3043860 RepID=UPI00313D1C90
MKVFEIELNNYTQWVAAPNMWAALAFIHSCTPLDDSDEPAENLSVEIIPESGWDEEWIGDEDKPGEHYSIRKALEGNVGHEAFIIAAEQ